LKEGSEDSKDMEPKDGSEANRAITRRTAEFEVMNFKEENSLEVPKGFPLSLTIQVVSIFLAWLVM